MKELYKSNTDKKIFGVCGGSGILIYIIAAILMPSNNVYKDKNIYRNRD